MLFKDVIQYNKMICQQCNLDKGNDFRKSRTVCRDCDNAKARDYTKELKSRQKPDYIICNVCNLKKTEFRINRRKCIDCEREHGRQYRRNKPEKAKEWRKNNSERMSELQHNWYEANKTEIRSNINKRYNNDEKFKLRSQHSSCIRSLIKGNSKSSKYINCSRDRLINWLQFQFTEGMTLENYGSFWTVDHVIPAKTFLTGEYDSNVIFNWNNIKPVEKKYNFSKNMHLDKNQCLNHLNNIKQYCKLRNLEEDSIYLETLQKICA